MSPLPQHGYVDTNTLAEHMDMVPSWVRQHAAELGGYRFGTAYRYDVQQVRAWINDRRIQTEPEGRRRKPGPKPGVGAIPANVRDW